MLIGVSPTGTIPNRTRAHTRVRHCLVRSMALLGRWWCERIIQDALDRLIANGLACLPTIWSNRLSYNAPSYLIDSWNCVAPTVKTLLITDTFLWSEVLSRVISEIDDTNKLAGCFKWTRVWFQMHMSIKGSVSQKSSFSVLIRARKHLGVMPPALPSAARDKLADTVCAN